MQNRNHKTVVNLIPTGHTGHTATPVAAQQAATVVLFCTQL